jgi:hypothetical protein
VIIILGLIVFAVAELEFFSNGTLEIRAETSGKYFSPKALAVTASVAGNQGTTPFNATLSQGSYTVNFGQIRWFKTPQPVSATVLKGTVVFADGIYNPIVRTIAIAGTSFNVSAVSAFHGVTPIVWLNTSDQNAILQCPQFRTQVILPHQNFTQVIDVAGSYAFTLENGSTNMTAVVS